MGDFAMAPEDQIEVGRDGHGRENGGGAQILPPPATPSGGNSSQRVTDR
jgi:hypothetical protein